MITVLFTCERCGLKDVHLQVPARESPLDDVCEWMQQTVLAVSERHGELSPRCRAKRLAALKIPMDKDDPNDWIGKQTDRIPPEDKP